LEVTCACGLIGRETTLSCGFLRDSAKGK